MYNIDLPKRWQKVYRKYLGSLGKPYLESTDYPNQILCVYFKDGSFSTFNYAFVLISVNLGEYLVLTGMCGYHIYLGESVASIDGTLITMS